MSTDGTQPPSIAPKKPARTGVRPADGTSPRVVGSTPAFAGPGAAGSVATDASPFAPTTSPSGPTSAGAPAGSPAGTSSTGRVAGPTTGSTATSGAAGAPGGASTTTATRPARSAEPDRAPRTAASPAASSGPRRVRLAVSRVDPWSVMKLSFLLSVAVGIMIVVAAAVVWYTLDGLHVFTKINDTVNTLGGATIHFNLLNIVGFSRVISLATMIAVVDVVLLTALSTIGAFLYNIVAALVGGIHLTLTDD